MQDFNKNVKNGWDAIFQKRLITEGTVPMNGEDDMSHEENVAMLKQDLAKAVKNHSEAVIRAGTLKDRFDSWFMKHAKGDTVSRGKANFSVVDFKTALNLYKEPEDTKLNGLRTVVPDAAPSNTTGGAPDGNSFAWMLFLNDYRKNYNAKRTAGAPQGAISQKPAEVGYNHPNVVDQQHDIQKDINDNMMPLMTVLYAGPEHKEELKSNPLTADMFNDPLVKGFLLTLDAQVAAMKSKERLEKAKEEVQNAVSSKSFDKSKLQSEPIDEPRTGTDPSAGQHHGPGRVQQEAVIVEQTETAEDIVNRNRKVLNENWTKYKEKNKDVKNTERPDDLTLLMG